jgi:hypothetical protein
MTDSLGGNTSAGAGREEAARTSLWGSLRRISRSLQVHGSLSSALMTRYDGLRRAPLRRPRAARTLLKLANSPWDSCVGERVPHARIAIAGKN